MVSTLPDAGERPLSRSNWTAGMLISMLALTMVAVQPMFAGALADKYGLDVRMLGILLGTEQAGGVLGALLAFWIIGRFDLRSIGAVSSLIAVIASVWTALSPPFEILLALRFLFSASSMTAYAVGIVVLARSIDPDRSFGIMLFLQTVFFAGYAAVFPDILKQTGFVFGLSSIALCFVFTMLAAFAMPARQQPQHTPREEQPSIGSLPKDAMLILIATSLLQASIMVEWGFLERVGQSVNISANQLGYAFSVGLLGGLPGSLLPGVLGRRLGHWPGIAIGTLFVLAANGIFAFTPAPLSHFTTALFVLNFGWCFAGAYYLGFIAQLDSNGRAARLIPFALAIGNMIGPLGVASITVGERFGGIFALSTLCASCGFAITCWVSSRRRPSIA